MARQRHNWYCAFISELKLEFIGLLIAVLQLVACFGFLPVNFNCCYRGACYVFVVTCSIGLILSGSSLNEILRSSTTPFEFSFQTPGLETTAELTGNLLFAVGSVLFLRTESNSAITAGTALFLIGSFFFGLGAFFNSIGVLTDGASDTPRVIVMLTRFSLLLSTFGVYAFVGGSLFFFPQLSPVATGAAGCGVIQTWSNTVFGTSWYIGGSALFLASDVTCFLSACMKRVQQPRQPSLKRVISSA